MNTNQQESGRRPKSQSVRLIEQSRTQLADAADLFELSRTRLLAKIVAHFFTLTQKEQQLILRPQLFAEPKSSPKKGRGKGPSTSRTSSSHGLEGRGVFRFTDYMRYTDNLMGESVYNQPSRA